MTSRYTKNSDGTASETVYLNNSPLVVTGTTITRPSDTNQYAFGDVVANSTTAASCQPSTIIAAHDINFPSTIRKCRLFKTGTSLTSALFRLHFYSQAPSFSNGDNSAWLTTSSGYIGSMDVTVDKAFQDGAMGTGEATVGSELNFVPDSGTKNIYCVIEARNTYTPISGEVFTITVEIE